MPAACPECLSGHKHDGAPVGFESKDKIHGRDCYVSEPPEGTPVKGLIVYIPDAFGWKFVNNRILADHYAARGFRVYLPEFMGGWAISEAALPLLPNLLATDRGIINWLLKPYYLVLMLFYGGPFLTFNRPSVAWPKIKTFVTALRESQDPKEKDLPIFAAGFCWGGKFVTLLTHGDSVTSTGAPLINAGFTAHPSMLSIPADIEKATRPLSIAVGTKDQVLDPKGAEQVRKILEERKEKEGVQYEVVNIDGAGHGFAVRADPGNEKVVEQAKMAEDQAITWFERFAKK